MDLAKQPEQIATSCLPQRMDTAIDLRFIARAYRKRALSALRAADRGVFQTLAEEFEREAQLAEKEERQRARRILANGSTSRGAQAA